MLFRNYKDAQDGQVAQRCVTAEGLNQSAQQAQQKESTKSIRETSRRCELSEIEEKDSPFEGKADKSSSKQGAPPKISSLEVHPAAARVAETLHQ